MHVKPVMLALPLALVLGFAAMYLFEYGTLNPFEPPSHVVFQGATFHSIGRIESLDSATRFEHNATFYANMPVVRVGTTLNGMAIYAMPLEQAPMDIYVEVSSGRFERYMRCCGP